MSAPLPLIYLARHGATAWSVTGQHTGRTDLPLTPEGESEAAALGRRLHGLTFAAVFTSPLQRARRTCEIAGFSASAVVDADLFEWYYGQYEGLTRAEIRQQRPDWQLFRDGCPSGESLAEVAGRADRVVAKARSAPGNVLLFSSGHLLRVLSARWLGLDPSFGARVFLSTASLSILGYEHTVAEPCIRLWNDVSHLDTALRS